MARKKRRGSLLALGLDKLDDLSIEIDDGFSGRNNGGAPGVTSNRERYFDRRAGRFHDPDTGMFEPGSPPPDLDASVNRYRAKNGQFKKRSVDLYDEPEEVRLDDLNPLG